MTRIHLIKTDVLHDGGQLVLDVKSLFKCRVKYLENLFSISTGDAACCIDLDLTLRFSDHIALWENDKTETNIT